MLFTKRRLLLLAGLAATLGARAETLTLPAAASIVGGAPFLSDVRAFNTSYTESLDVLATYRCFIPASCAVDVGRPQFTFRLNPRESRAFDDMVVSEFQAPDTAGGVEFEFAGAPTDLVVTSRLYSTSPVPTVGMFIPAMHASEAHAATVLTSIRHDPGGAPGGFRTNVGVFNPAARTAAVTFAIFEDGIALGAPVTRPAPAHSGVQVSAIFEAAGAGGVSTENAVITVSATEPVFSYAAVIDNTTTDPIFVVGANDLGAATPTNTPGGPTSTPSRTATFGAPSRTPTSSATPTRTTTAVTQTSTFTASATRTLTPTGPTRTSTQTLTPSQTFTPSLTFTITQTPTITLTPTQTQTFTSTQTFTPTQTVSPTFTRTPTNRTPTLTASRTSTSTLTPTGTNTLTPTRTNTVTPSVTRTPTLTPTPNTNHIVFVDSNFFEDSITGTNLTTITAGETIEWVWVLGAGLHSTTSGTCVGTNCTPDGFWNSGNHNPPFSFTRNFPTATTHSYYCMIHGSMMVGAINVLPPP